MHNTTYIDSFKRYLSDERNAPTNTILSYTRDISQFADFLLSGEKTGFTDVTEDEVRSFLLKLEESGRSPATVSRTLASLKAFFVHMADKGLIMVNPAAGINGILVPKKPPRTLTSQEIERLLEQPDVRDPKGCRDRAMLETLYATGIRVSELVMLERSDVNLVTGLIVCRNGRERVIPIYAAAVKAIEVYLNTTREKIALPEETALFVNTRGIRMSRQGFWKVLKSYAVKARIKKDITPQILRNSFAAHLLENGADIRSLQEMLGHADIASTQVYARVVKQHLKDVYHKVHPKA